MNDYEEREAALNMKIKFFQRKIRELKEELDYRSGAIREAKAKLAAAREIEGLRDHMRTSLNEEVNRKCKENELLRKTINSLSDEKFDIENENNYFASKMNQLRDDNNNLHIEEENVKRKVIMIERDLQNIKEKHNIKEKSRSSTLNENDYKSNILDKVTNELSQAKSKNEEMSSKMNDIREKINNDKESIIYERKLYEDLLKINEKLNDNIVKGKQDINTLDLRIKNIKNDIKENKDIACNSQKDGDLLVKKLQNLYDQLYAINTTNNEVKMI